MMAIVQGEIIPGVYEVSRNSQKPKQAAATTTENGKDIKNFQKHSKRKQKQARLHFPVMSS